MGGERVADALGPWLAALQQQIANNNNNNNNNTNDIYAVEHAMQHKGLYASMANMRNEHLEQQPFSALRTLKCYVNAAAVPALVRPFARVTQLTLRLSSVAGCGSPDNAAADPRHHVHEGGRAESCTCAVMMVAIAAAMPRLRQLCLILEEFVPVPRAAFVALSSLVFLETLKVGYIEAG
jgi:hypothetical protein